MARAVTIHHMNVPIDDVAAARDFYGRELHLSVQPSPTGVS
jgi:extradiol dioxygenase family protein